LLQLRVQLDFLKYQKSKSTSELGERTACLVY